MKPKAALVKAGLKPAEYENSRGRMSAADKDAVADLAVKHPDWNIEVPGQPAPVSVSPSQPTAVVTDKPKVGGTGIVDIGPPIRHEEEWDAFVTVSGKRSRFDKGIKGVCLNCNNSLTYCFCRYSVVFVDHQTLGIIEYVRKR
jgi:hypothetical protein